MRWYHGEVHDQWLENQVRILWIKEAQELRQRELFVLERKAVCAAGGCKRLLFDATKAVFGTISAKLFYPQYLAAQLEDSRVLFQDWGIVDLNLLRFFLS